MLARGLSFGQALIGGVIALGVAAGVLVLVVPLVVAELTGGSSYQVRDDSMAPALLAGDWVLAEPLPDGDLPPRGAIIAYDSPAEPGFSEVRRLVGLPGERIQMRGGAVYIDGKRAQMTRQEDRVIRRRPPARRTAMPFCMNDPVEIDGDCRQEVWRETLPDGTETLVINSAGKIGAVRFGDRNSGNDTTVIRVPDDAVFVLGDNRDASVDSRSQWHGTVPISSLRHRVWMIHSSLDKSSRFPRPRFDRFFRRVP